jgi:putative NIF3 family GTP cyclohydrolase 1 type 2
MAELLKLNYLCTHTITDNLAHLFIQRLLQEHKPDTLGELVDLLKTIPEYKQAALNGQGPMIIAGAANNSCGKISLGFTGGTEASKEFHQALATYGVNTLLTMHIKETMFKDIAKTKLNIVIAGHIASDSLGMNLFLDELEKEGIEIVPISGLIRVKRFRAHQAINI